MGTWHTPEHSMCHVAVSSVCRSRLDSLGPGTGRQKQADGHCPQDTAGGPQQGCPLLPSADRGLALGQLQPLVMSFRLQRPPLEQMVSIALLYG